MIFGHEENFWQAANGTWTAKEIYQQPATWKKTLKQIKEKKDEIKAFIDPLLADPNLDIIFTGAGTSEYVGNALFSFINTCTGFRAKSYATTDLVETPENYLDKNRKTLLVSFGRSGNSPESVGAVQVADKVLGDNVYHLFITCNKNGALAKAAQTRDNALDINLTDETHDQSFAMTSSFSNMMLAAMLCFNLDHLVKTEAELEDVILRGQHFLDHGYVACEDLVKSYDFNRIVYLGANVLKGIAQESQLKICELTAGQVTTTFDSPLGFRHGPKSVVNDETLTVIYISDDPYQRQYEYDLIKEMASQRKGNKLVAVAARKYEDIEELVDLYIDFGLLFAKDNMYLAFDYILVAQVIALFKSISLGITPDNPCPTGEVNRVVQGVTIYPYELKSEVEVTEEETNA
ncbi:SIS domain-containing protein [Allobaculum mucilyticum]|uniref:SIS domain-containing protein n=1 Tax=Allobaculum mucilyticum TaxID=2834459 RepID=UPI001E587852|nr:SIS domain-containing protein [Allobaculum mucilyticum]UNT96580.1 SIS domain-containing protein [Allobaculum mucilyticum]